MGLVMSLPGQWNPEQYHRFRNERTQPFYDLAAMVQVRPGMRVIDLGCGSGELTATLAERWPDCRVLGVDSAGAMLEQAAGHAGERVRFVQQDIATVAGWEQYDVVFSNAALQWVPDNAGLLERMLGGLPSGAQVAIQVPKNDNHPSHLLAPGIARRSPFKELLGGFERWSHALAMEQYAQLMWDHGFRDQVCMERLYNHVLPSSADVVEWVKGTSLSAYLTRLQEPHRTGFLDAYRSALLAEIGDQQPYFYPFRRLLFWGRKD